VLSRDSRERSLAKTIVYRLVAIALLAALSFYYTGNAGEATTITILFNVLGALAYYGLERLWENVEWGKARPSIAKERGDKGDQGRYGPPGLGAGSSPRAAKSEADSA